MFHEFFSKLKSDFSIKPKSFKFATFLHKQPEKLKTEK